MAEKISVNLMQAISSLSAGFCAWVIPAPFRERGKYDADFGVPFTEVFERVGCVTGTLRHLTVSCKALYGARDQHLVLAC